MRHGIFSGNNSLNVTVRLAGCHIDVIFKLHTTPTVSEAASHTKSQPMLQVFQYLVAMFQALQTIQGSKDALTLLVTGFNGRK